jgi:kynurenine formamidase
LNVFTPTCLIVIDFEKEKKKKERERERERKKEREKDVSMCVFVRTGWRETRVVNWTICCVRN